MDISFLCTSVRSFQAQQQRTTKQEEDQEEKAHSLHRIVQL